MLAHCKISKWKPFYRQVSIDPSPKKRKSLCTLTVWREHVGYLTCLTLTGSVWRPHPSLDQRPNRWYREVHLRGGERCWGETKGHRPPSVWWDTLTVISALLWLCLFKSQDHGGKVREIFGNQELWTIEMILQDKFKSASPCLHYIQL